MGIISGVLILQGNPSELLDSSLFKDNDSLDIYGLVLDSKAIQWKTLLSNLLISILENRLRKLRRLKWEIYYRKCCRKELQIKHIQRRI